MRLSLLFSFLLVCGAAEAQSTLGYFFVAPGGISANGQTRAAYQVGGGVEKLLTRDIGAGGELSGMIPGHGPAKNAVGIFSVNGYYHFLSDRKLDPYATAGYSLLFRTATANLYNVGGGLHYWFQDNLGLTLELRDQVRSGSGSPANSGAVHYWGVRIGLSFR